jgi:hypothetical protein
LGVFLTGVLFRLSGSLRFFKGFRRCNLLAIVLPLLLNGILR